jgi:KDO2-lipid IV(A) lauroyltransferase
MGYLVFWLTRLVIAFFWLLPFRLLHGLSDVLVFVLHDVVRYRRRVVYDNLRRVYPDIQEGELGKLARLTYRNMSDVLLETLKSFTLSPESIRARCVCVDSSVVNSFLNSGQSVLVSGSHLCNWEWACLSIPFGISGRAVTIYKPLSNRFFDAYFNNKRRRGGMNLVNMDEVYYRISLLPVEGMCNGLLF